MKTKYAPLGYAPRHITGKHGDGGVRRIVTQRLIKKSEPWIDISPKKKPGFWSRMKNWIAPIRQQFTRARNRLSK